ncbi:hypothetical protein Tco_1390870 [Tanacetum coccineum]
MEHTFELMDIIPPTLHDSPLLGGYTPRSDEGRLKLEELMVMCIKLSKLVLDLEKEKDAQAVEILKLKKRIKKLERQRKSSISHPKRRIYSDFDDLDDLVDEGMTFVQEKDAENQEKIGVDDTVAVNTTCEGVSIAAPRTPPITTTVFDDEVVTMAMAMAQTLIKMKEKKAKEKGVAIKDVEDFSRPIRSIITLQPLPNINPKEKGKGILQEIEPMEKTKKKVQGNAQIERDAEIALRLQAELDEELRVERERQEEASKVSIADMFDEVQASIDADYELAARMTHKEQEKYTIEERARLLAEFFERRKKQLVAKRAEAIRNKPPTKTQLRNLMMTYLKNMGGYNHSQLKGKSYEEIQGFYERQQKRIQDFTPIDSEKETQKPGKRLKRVVGSYATQKSPKKPKVMKSAKDVTEEEAAEYEKEKEELRADGSSSYYGDTQAFLRRLDRKDLNNLYRLVQERFQDHPLEGHDLLVWGDLRMIFDPDEKGGLWMNELDWKLLRWKLYENYGVHTLFMDGKPMEINMIVEKKYPLIKELLEKMLTLQLENEEESTMAFELIKFIKSLLEE